MVGRRGWAAVEAMAGVAVAVLIAVSAAAALRARVVHVRHAYEEAVAREIAFGRLERLEAGNWAGLAAGRMEVELDSPGSENLADARCAIEAGPAGAVAVEVSWAPSPGTRRSVRVRTAVGRVP